MQNESPIMRRMVTMALIGQTFRKMVEERAAIEKLVEALNKVFEKVRLEYDLGSRNSAIVSLNRRAVRVAKGNDSMDDAVALKELRRIAKELAGVLKNYNAETPNRKLPQHLIDALTEA